MPTRFSIVVDDDRAHDIEHLAHEHDLTEEEVLRQLLTLGLEALEEDRPVGGRPERDVTGKTDADP
ncbi:CopG family protein [Halorhabdus tiamatea SARL4B]|uniref:CopG family protein n=1 Tax=Halorhabdus tiamatea SARL4B TaxID=1033806 RepID=F7PM25_9EURY|nr:hypothetical protein [Halorhabdus tiamatea]ERJ06366.1 CopG family protein [Halorhabdus tiamatea SARL4B]CCQ34534.1 conserved hypothetical protein [Halorhabdus tiamatea SARL4B]